MSKWKSIFIKVGFQFCITMISNYKDSLEYSQKIGNIQEEEKNCFSRPKNFPIKSRKMA